MCSFIMIMCFEKFAKLGHYIVPMRLSIKMIQVYLIMVRQRNTLKHIPHTALVNSVGMQYKDDVLTVFQTKAWKSKSDFM